MYYIYLDYPNAKYTLVFKMKISYEITVLIRISSRDNTSLIDSYSYYQ